MPRNAWKETMDEAADRAMSNYAEWYAGASEEEKRGADTVVAWIEEHYRAAGYKRLCRGLLAGGRYPD